MNRTKRKIFQTAVELFAKKGYENTGIEEITAVAGYAKGSLYYHFGTKEDLFDMLLEEGFNLLNNSIEIKFRKCNNALDKLRAIMLVQIKVIIKYEDFITVIINNTLGENSRTKKCQAYLNEYIKIVSNVIKEGIDEGLFYNGDQEAIAYGIFGITFSSLLYRLKKERNLTVEEIYNGYEATIVRGLTRNIEDKD